MAKQYSLPPNTSMADLLHTLEHLKDDANDEFTALAREFTRFGHMETKAKAMYYQGHIEMLDKLIWVLSGQAENDGCEPNIYIQDRKDLA